MNLAQYAQETVKPHHQNTEVNFTQKQAGTGKIRMKHIQKYCNKRKNQIKILFWVN
jgi:hypothetical protein